ncbi:MAG: hypothetical protein ACYDEV_15900 [Acidiferrobacter sp.]
MAIQVLFDPDYSLCHTLWLKMQRYRHSPLVIRWVPIALVRASTVGKAAAIVTARDPLKALAIDEQYFQVVNQAGGILPLYRVPPALRHAIRYNTRLLTRLDSLVPTLLYRERHRIGLVAGVPTTERLARLMRTLSAVTPP